ncbi:MAG: MarR family winged helix-turn-helix transcriptional regulator [Bacteroidia bacterium]
MAKENTIELRQLSQQYAYSSLQMHETIARKLGFSATDHKYLSFFLVKGKLTAGELAELSGLTTGAVTGLIDRFEKKKLVKREYDASDRRKVFIVPNKEKIMALFEPFYKNFQDETDKIINSFSAKEIAIIESYLLKSIELAKKTNTNFNK